jgi:hypothetical protein
MTAQILPFVRAKPAGALERAGSAREASEADIRSFIKDLREDLALGSGRVKLRRKLRGDEDAVLLAQRLGADLERIKRLGRGQLTEILLDAGQPLTSRARFALFAGEAPTAEKRTRKLQPYVLLSDSIARALGRDVDLFLYEKLDGLNLVEPKRTTDEEALKLNLLLERMARAIAEKEDLVGFFDLAARTPGAMDEWGGIHSFATWTYLPPSMLPVRRENPPPTRMTVLRDRRHEGSFDHWTEQQPLPSVPVCRILEQTIHGHARVAPWAEASTENPENLFCEVDAISAEHAVPITLEIWREFRLSLGERYQRGEIGPMFSGRAHIKVHIDGVVATPFYPWTLEHFFQEKPALLVDGSRWTACRAEFDFAEEFSDRWIEPVAPPGEESYAVEHCYFSQHPVNAWHLRRLLDRSEFGDPRAESLLDDVPYDKRPELYRFSGEIGQRFEVALSSGALEDALCADINRLKGELDRYLSERREKLAAQDDATAARWQSADQTDSDIPEGN